MSQLKTHAHRILTQLNAKYGLNALGGKGDEAIQKKLRQATCMEIPHGKEQRWPKIWRKKKSPMLPNVLKIKKRWDI